MMSDNLLAFIGTAAVITVTPGLDTAIVLRTAAMEGPRHGMSAALGIGAGCLCWGGAVAFGLGALLIASPSLFWMVKLAGAVYLLWLGANMLMRPRQMIGESGTSGMAATGSMWCSARRGFTTNILNPKAGLFYITLVPQFVPNGAPAAYPLLLAGAHVMLAIVWFIALAVMIDTVRPHLCRPGMLPLLDRLLGCVFIGFGLHLTMTAGV